MKRLLILVSLAALPVLIGTLVATCSPGMQLFSIVLACFGGCYLGVSVYLRNKQRPLAMNLMLMGEICFVTGVILYIWFYKSMGG